MRIISGKHRGRRIDIPRGLNGVRPTSDYAREAIFNILTHGKGGLSAELFIDKPVLDVFCGTGALGLEALSRSAGQVTFIDKNRDAIATARHNAERMGELAFAQFLVADATRLPKSSTAYALVFLDPPYFEKLLPAALGSLLAGGWVNSDTLLVTEQDAKEPFNVPVEFQVIDERRYGRAQVRLLKTA